MGDNEKTKIMPELFTSTKKRNAVLILSIAVLAIIVIAILIFSYLYKERQKQTVVETAADIITTESTIEELMINENSTVNTNNNWILPTAEDDPNATVLNVWSYTNEVPDMVLRYMELHPELDIQIKVTVMATAGYYPEDVFLALEAGGVDAPDIYTAESSFVYKYVKGERAGFACPYTELGLDVDMKIREEGISPYTVDIGTNKKGQIVALGYQGTGGAFIYRRSIAIDTWGTDDPTEIAAKIGPGWEKFFIAAEDLKVKGYSIVSSDGDVWHAVENSAETPWVVNGRLNIDPKREAFLDISKKLSDKGYHNNTVDWQDDWFNDMKDMGDKPVFGFFGPAWMVNYVMVGNCGGEKVGEGTYGDWAVCMPTEPFYWGGTWIFANKDTKLKKTVGEIIEWITLDGSEAGLQYEWANGTYSATNSIKDTVTSSKVMAISDGSVEFLGGQNMFDIFIPAGERAKGDNQTEYDETINWLWRKQVQEYAAGNKSRDQAIEDFKKQVADKIDIVVE